MFSKIGTGELLVILTIAIVVIGPAKLPEIARSLGKALGSAKKYMRDVTDEIQDASAELTEVQKDLRDMEQDIKQPLKSKKIPEGETSSATEKEPAPANAAETILTAEENAAQAEL